MMKIVKTKPIPKNLKILRDLVAFGDHKYDDGSSYCVTCYRDGFNNCYQTLLPLIESIDTLYDDIKHGDDEHKRWLKEKIDDGATSQRRHLLDSALRDLAKRLSRIEKKLYVIEAQALDAQYVPRCERHGASSPLRCSYVRCASNNPIIRPSTEA